MALPRHLPVHLPQPLHFSAEIQILLLQILIAFSGQPVTHAPHNMHFSGVTSATMRLPFIIILYSG
jgi:hypothetical protein